MELATELVRLSEKYTLQEIGEKRGISKQRVEQIIRSLDIKDEVEGARTRWAWPAFVGAWDSNQS